MVGGGGRAGALGLCGEACERERGVCAWVGGGQCLPMLGEGVQAQGLQQGRGEAPVPPARVGAESPSEAAESCVARPAAPGTVPVLAEAEQPRNTAPGKGGIARPPGTAQEPQLRVGVLHSLLPPFNLC